MPEWKPRTLDELISYVWKELPRAKRRSTQAVVRADEGVSLASGAIDSANGKNTIRFRAAAPTTSADDAGKADGDLWFVIPNVQTGIVTGQYTWMAATQAWVQQTLSSAVLASIDAGKITTGTLVGITITGVTITGSVVTGGTVQTSSSGKRVVLANNVITFWGLNGSNAVAAGVIEGIPNGADRGMIQIRSATDGTQSMQFGNTPLPVASSVEAYADRVWIQDLYVTRLWDVATNQLIAAAGSGPSTIPVASGYTGTGLTAVKSGYEVSLQGQLATSNGANLAASAANVGTLSAPFQPAQPQIFLVAGANGFIARVQIASNGVISYSILLGSSSYLRFDAVNYRTV